MIENMSVWGHSTGRWIAGVALAIGLADAVPSLAQGPNLFYIGATEPICDETGSNKLYGTATEPGCLVQIILVTNTNDPAPPPFNPDGTVNTNVVLYEEGTACIGDLTSPADPNPGVYSKVATALTGQTRIVARAFNASDIYDATYYGDSPVFTNGSASKFAVNIDATTNALDNTDSDGDGLIDRWERYMGTSVGSVDSDGDGMSDGEEKRAGTDALSDASHLTINAMYRNGNDLVVEWPSVAGKRYEVEYVDGLVDSVDGFGGISTLVTAYGSVSQVTITGALEGSDSRQFRVILNEAW